MEIHRFEKIWLVVSLLLIVGFIVTITYGAVGAGVAMIDDSGGTIDSSNPTDSPEFREPGVYSAEDVETTGDASAATEGEHAVDYHVYVLSRQFAFEPGTNEPIQVPAESTVRFHITSVDVIHGFEVAGTNVNIMVIPGQIATATVEFDEEATYGIVCNEYCGASHHNMGGQLQVVDPESYEGPSATGGDEQ
jgi:cytochrome c oxidase subunit 2